MKTTALKVPHRTVNLEGLPSDLVYALELMIHTWKKEAQDGNREEKKKENAKILRDLLAMAPRFRGPKDLSQRYEQLLYGDPQV